MRRPLRSVARGARQTAVDRQRRPGNRPPAVRRADPVVLLSAGTVVDLSAAIAADMADVRGGGDALHVLVGGGVIGWAPRGDARGARETRRVARDNPPGVYDADTGIAMGTPRGGVVAHALVAGPDSVMRAGFIVGRDG